MANIKIIDLQFLGLPKSIGAFIIETSDGPLLVETGPHSTLKHLESGLKNAGYTLPDIKHIFLTHIHLDHAGAAWYFAQQGAKVYVHPKGYRHMASPEKLMASAKMIYQDKMDELWGQMNPISEDQLVAVEDLQEFQFGEILLQAHFTPGHAVHHIAWQIDNALIAGDVAGIKINKGPVMPPCPPPDINVEDWVTSIAKIKKLKIKEMYLVHFGKVTEVDQHLDELQDILWDWANWMKPHFEQKTAPKVITPLFQEYVSQQLAKAGVDKLGQSQYEGANPAWMSVAGLLRYWKIKARTELEQQ